MDNSPNVAIDVVFKIGLPPHATPNANTHVPGLDGVYVAKTPVSLATTPTESHRRRGFNAKVGEILRSRVTPEFKQGNFGVGILNGTEAIVTVLNGDTLASSTTTSTQAQSTQVQTNNTRKPNNNGESADNVVFILMMLGLGGIAWIGAATGGGSSSSNSTYNNDSSNFSSGGGYSGGGGNNYSGGSDFGGGGSGGGGGGDSW